MRLNCPHCSQHLEIDPASAGQNLQCPACHQEFAVPALPKAVPVAMPVAPRGVSKKLLISLAAGVVILGGVVVGLLIGKPRTSPPPPPLVAKDQPQPPEPAPRPEPVPNSAASEATILRGHTGPVMAVSVSKKSDFVFSGGADGSIRIWPITDGKWDGSCASYTHPAQIRNKYVAGLALSADERWLASSGFDGRIGIWRLDQGKASLLTELTSITNLVTPLKFSPDNQWLAAVQRKPGRIYLWAIAGEKFTESARLEAPGCEVWSLGFAPDSKRMAVGVIGPGASGGAVWLWDLTQSPPTKRVLLAETGLPRSVTFSPDGRRLAFGIEHTIHLIDAASGEALGTFNGHASGKTIIAIKFSPDGKRLLSGSEDSTIRYWDIATRQELQRFEGDFKGVEDVEFAGDGQFAVSGTKDNLVRVWRLNGTQGAAGASKQSGGNGAKPEALDAAQTAEKSERIAGSFGGIGATLGTNNGVLQVESVVAASPAERAGLLAGWDILRIDGTSTAGMTVAEAKKLVKGDIGTEVKLEVRPPDGTSRQISITRGKLLRAPVQSRRLDGGLLVLRPTFYDLETGPQFRALLNQHADATGIVLDLRGSVDGVVDVIAQVAGVFLRQDSKLWFVGDAGGRITERPNRESPRTRLPVVVLANRRTSAAELLASALQRNRRALVVGQPTSGYNSATRMRQLVSNVDGSSHMATRDSNLLSRDGSVTNVVPDRLLADSASEEDFLNAARAVLALPPAPTPTPEQPAPPSSTEAGFVALLNGHDLTGWSGEPGMWQFENGVLIGEQPATATAPTGARGHLHWTNEMVGDFELRFVFRVPRGNSGVLYRSQDFGGGDCFGYEFVLTDQAKPGGEIGQVFEHGAQGLRPTKVNGRGHLGKPGTKVRVEAGRQIVADGPPQATLAQAIRAVKLEDWNEGAIIAQGRRLTHLVNGVVITEVDDRAVEPARLSGAIGFKISENSRVELKEVRLRKLGANGQPTPEPAPPTTTSDETSFVELFNGKDLTGWKTDATGWSVVDGAISASNAPRSYLTWTGGTVENFELRFSFRLTSGIAKVQYRGRQLQTTNAANRVQAYTFELAGLETNGQTGELWEDGDSSPGTAEQNKGRRKLSDLGRQTVRESTGKDSPLGHTEKTANQLRASIRAGDWNDAVIRVEGKHHLLKLNGNVAVDLLDLQDSRSRAGGTLGLRATSPETVVQFKNIRLKKLP